MRFLSLFILLTLPLFAIKVYNGTTALIEFAKIPKNATVTLGKKELPLLKHPKDPSKRFILAPINYRSEIGQKEITVQYTSGKKEISLKILKGTYRSETIQVASSKVTPNKKQRERTSREYKEAMKIYHSSTAKRYWSKPFILPMNSKITSPFGTARMFNGTLKSYHSGTDFRAAVGTPIIASNDGVIVLAKDRYYAGKSILIDHGEGIYSCYYHLSDFHVNVGEAVKQGETIGLSGATGRVSGPHLHYAFMVQGVQVDPLDFHEKINSLFD